MRELSIFDDEYAGTREGDPEQLERFGVGGTVGGSGEDDEPLDSIFRDDYSIAARGISRNTGHPDHLSPRQAGEDDEPLDSIFYDDYAVAA